MIAYVAFFEAQLEELFVGLMTGQLIHSQSHVRPVVILPNKRAAKSIISAGRAYVDWLPYEQHLKRRAPSFFVDGAPFVGLDSVSRAALEKATTIRNALAHASDHSQKSFEKKFITGRQIPVSQRRPAPYLRGQHSIGRTRFDATVSELVLVMQQLTS